MRKVYPSKYLILLGYQGEAQLAFNQLVAGSNPARPTKHAGFERVTLKGYPID
jgi:hypothetical protein